MYATLWPHILIRNLHNRITYTFYLQYMNNMQSNQAFTNEYVEIVNCNVC